VAKAGGIAFASLRRVDGLGDQRRKLYSGLPHPLEVGDQVCQIVPTCILDQNVDEANDRGDRGAELLLQKGGDSVL
jgi:hypothetical protein